MTPEQLPTLIDKLITQTNAHKIEWERFSDGVMCTIQSFTFYLSRDGSLHSLFVRDAFGKKVIEHTPGAFASVLNVKMRDLYDKVDCQLTNETAEHLVSILDGLD